MNGRRKKAGIGLALIAAALSLPSTVLAAENAVQGSQINTTVSDKGAKPTAVPVPSRFGAQEIDEAFGAFQRGLYVTARNLALPRAEAGDGAAQTLLAEIYSRGLGVRRDIKEAGKWYEKAARQGISDAKFQYALILLNDPLLRDDAEQQALANRYMQEAADAGNRLAMFNYAQLLLTGTPGGSGRRDAYRYFRGAAEKNVADAQYAVAQYYANGTGGVNKDEEKARQWLARAAQLNFGSAQLEYGQMLLSGVGGGRDYDQGFAWIRRSALGGNVIARAELAKLYWAGIGTEPDETRAGAWYVLARRAGFRDRVLEDFWMGLSETAQRDAIVLANTL